jgi:chromosomal replication initiation ATPase DnaA
MRLSPRQIIALIADEHRLTVRELRSRCRRPEIFWPRHTAMFFVAEFNPQMSRAKIGKVFNRDQNAVRNALRAVQNRIETEPAWAAHIIFCRTLLVWTEKLETNE